MYNLTIIITLSLLLLYNFILCYILLYVIIHIFYLKNDAKIILSILFQFLFFSWNMEIEKLQKKTNMAIIYIYLYYIQTFSRGNYYNLIINFAFYTIINT